MGTKHEGAGSQSSERERLMQEAQQARQAGDEARAVQLEAQANNAGTEQNGTTNKE